MPFPPPAATDIEPLLLQHKYLAAVRRVSRGVAHNYNNIFTGLGGQTAILRQEAALEAPDDKRRGLIDSLLQRGIEQTSILYEFCRDDPAESAPQSPLLVAGKALELLNTVSRLHRFRLRGEIRREKIAIAPRQLLLVLFYLGENCVDATPEGDEISLWVALEKPSAVSGGAREGGSGQRVVFTFQDHGPGFAREQELAFGRPFNCRRGAASCRGLGIYAAGALAARAGGSLGLRREGDTTLVSAAYPLLVEEQAADPQRAGTASQRSRQVARQCFLVVEDDEALRTLLLNRLQRRGHMVFCVDSCAEAEEEFNHLHDIITIVLMDVGLRDASGYDCSRRLAAIAPGVRVIFMSGEQQPAANAAEGNIFLQKPFTMDQLEQAILDVHL